jgi:hypothetical protein
MIRNCPDGVIDVYSPELIKELEAAGCRRVGTQGNKVLFHATSTVWEIIKTYARNPRRSESHRSDVALLRSGALAGRDREDVPD